MINLIKKKCITVCYLSMLVWLLSAGGSSAQQARLALDLQVNEAMANAQIVNIANLFTIRGKRSNLFTLLVQNESTDQAAEDLYFNIRFRSQKRGLIANLYQRNGQSFSLRPARQLYITSSNLDDGLPGVEGNVKFDGGLTNAGERFFNELGGLMMLPPDEYTIQVHIYQEGNGVSGGTWIASAEERITGELVEDLRDIYLTGPGGVAGTNAQITNPYPEFRWEGSSGVNYRLIVVEAKGQDSPQSLLQGAMSTEPAEVPSGIGNFLDYEIIDLRINKTSFQFPTSGVQVLEAGKEYFWQVLMELNTSNGRLTRVSEIWSFVLADQSPQGTVELSSRLAPVLQQLLGEDRFRELQNGGFRLQSLVIEGETVSGSEALQRLMELNEKLDQGAISIQTD